MKSETSVSEHSCGECGKPVDAAAKICPHCNEYLTEDQTSSARNTAGRQRLGSHQGEAVRYPNLVHAGANVTSSGSLLSTFGILVGVVGVLGGGFMVVNGGSSALPGIAVGGFGIVGGIVVYGFGVFLSAAGEAALALADIALNTERIAGSIRPVAMK